SRWFRARPGCRSRVPKMCCASRRGGEELPVRAEGNGVCRVALLWQDALDRPGDWVPQTDGGPLADREELAVRAARQRELLVAGSQNRSGRLAGGGAPSLRTVVSDGGEDAAVGAERRDVDGAVGVEDMCRRPGGRLPQTNVSLDAGQGEQPSIRA